MCDADCLEYLKYLKNLQGAFEMRDEGGEP